LLCRRICIAALRWRDIDMATGTISIRRSAGVVRNKGEGAEITEGTTKTNKTARDRHRPGNRRRAEGLAIGSRRAGAGAGAGPRRCPGVRGYQRQHLHPERFSRTFKTTLAECRRQLGETAPPEIRLHDLRYTHATILLADLREHIKVVSERLGHASVTVTLTVYSHVMPGNLR